MKIILAGGTGFLGRSLGTFLAQRGHQVTVLTRRPQGTEVGWDGRTVGPWTAELEGADAIVNLVGKSVNCRYTLGARQEIVASRIDSVRAIEQALARCAVPPPVWIQATSLAIYGDAGDRWCDETAPAGEGFPVETCLAWEEAFLAAQTAARKVALRIGFALGAQGGVLATLTSLVRAFLGGRVGDGRQYISWIHLADLNRMFLAAIDDATITGIYNAGSPHPVTNDEFMATLRQALHRPWSPPVPIWAVHLGARLLGTQPELALAGRRCAPARFLAAGFDFQFPELAPALADLFPTQI